MNKLIKEIIEKRLKDYESEPNNSQLEKKLLMFAKQKKDLDKRIKEIKAILSGRAEKIKQLKDLLNGGDIDAEK